MGGKFSPFATISHAFSRAKFCKGVGFFPPLSKKFMPSIRAMIKYASFYVSGSNYSKTLTSSKYDPHYTRFTDFHFLTGRPRHFLMRHSHQTGPTERKWSFTFFFPKRVSDKREAVGIKHVAKNNKVWSDKSDLVVEFKELSGSVLEFLPATREAQVRIPGQFIFIYFRRQDG